MFLHLKNPHSIIAALKTRPQDVQQITLPSSHSSQADIDPWKKIEDLARINKIKVSSASNHVVSGRNLKGSEVTRSKKNFVEGGRINVAEARIAERQPVDIGTLFDKATDKKNGLWLALDCLQDPHNVGAIFRAASFFGVQGIILTQERSAPLSATVYDVASGGVEYVPFSLAVNLQRAFEAAKDAGLWILGTSEHAHDSISKIDRDRPWLLVFGNEEKGLRRLTEEACDVLCQIPPQGQVTSLNVSVAAGIFISKLSGSC